MANVQKWVAETTDEEMFTKLGNLHGTDYKYVLMFLKDGGFKRAVDYLRFEALDKIPNLEGAMYFVHLVKRFEGIE